MKRRIWSTLLVMCFVFALLPASAGAADVVASGTCGDHATWVITDDGVMTISGTGTVTAPMDLNAFADHGYRIKTIRIGEGITEIAERAFSSAAYEEETLLLPDSLKTIGPYAFYGNAKLKEISFGSGLVTIGKCAFESCWNLGAIDLPDGLLNLCEGAFSCTGLEEVVVPGSVKTVGNGAFNSCSRLKTAVIMDGVEGLDNLVFNGCYQLEDVYLADTIRWLGMGVFYNCSSLKEARLPASSTLIPESTFVNCTSLEYVIVPGTVKRIEKCAFDNCTALTEFYYAGTESMLNSIQIDALGNTALADVAIYLIPAMPDPVFGFFDMPAPSNWAYPGIAFCLYTGLMNGVGNGYFQPNGTTTRAQLVTILWRLMGEPEATKPAPFTDLKQDWYREAVAWAAENNITNGTSAATFSPDQPVTREQMVTIFYRMCRDYLKMDVSPAASLAGFPDSASVSAWAQDAMQWAVAVKLISGVGDGRGNSYLQPQGSATRAQIATVMLNFVNAFGSEAEAAAAPYS